MINKILLIMLSLAGFLVCAASLPNASDHQSADKTGQQKFNEMQSFNLQGEDIIKHLPRFIKIGIFPGLTADNYFAEDITKNTVGASKQQIILLGKYRSNSDKDASSRNEADREILYILKKTKNVEELDNIEAAYKLWRGSTGENGIITANVIKPQKKADGKWRIGQSTYRLKLAWHERIFWDSSTDTYYELLHAAKGQLMFDYTLPRVPYIGVYNKGRMVPEFITSTGDNADVESFGYEGAVLNPIYCEMLRITRNLPDDGSKKSFMKSGEFPFAAVPGGPMQEFYLGTVLGSSALPFKINNGAPEVDDQLNWEEAYTAYEAFGAVLGTVFREKNIEYNKGDDLDPHQNNIFFDKSSNTITWIDLDMLGGKLSGTSTTKLGGQEPALHQALRHAYWQGIFMGKRPIHSYLFEKGVLAFHPDANAEGILKLKSERDRIFNNIRRLYESFANAFIQNYDPSDKKRQEMKNYFRTTFVFPFNENPQWKDPEERKFGIYDPFVCYELKE